MLHCKKCICLPCLYDRYRISRMLRAMLLHSMVAIPYKLWILPMFLEVPNSLLPSFIKVISHPNKDSSLLILTLSFRSSCNHRQSSYKQRTRLDREDEKKRRKRTIVIKESAIRAPPGKHVPFSCSGVPTATPVAAAITATSEERASIKDNNFLEHLLISFGNFLNNRSRRSISEEQ